MGAAGGFGKKLLLFVSMDSGAGAAARYTQTLEDAKRVRCASVFICAKGYFTQDGSFQEYACSSEGRVQERMRVAHIVLVLTRAPNPIVLVRPRGAGRMWLGDHVT